MSSPVHVFLSLSDLPSVTSVLADYSCVSASAVVSWGTVYGTDSYHATAVDQNGRTISCTSTGTTCLLANLDCGRDYMVWVSAIAKNCESTSSISAFFQTGEWGPLIWDQSSSIRSHCCLCGRMALLSSLLINTKLFRNPDVNLDDKWTSQGRQQQGKTFETLWGKNLVECIERIFSISRL